MKRIRALPKLPERDPHGHKGLYGRILVVGGSVGMVGAPALTANAALRSGAGLVRIACPTPAQQAIATLAPCATTTPLPANRSGQLAPSARNPLTRLLTDQDVLAIGPGLGQADSIRHMVRDMLARFAGRPAVVDADALNALAASGPWWKSVPGPLVLTPHPGEMHRLLNGARISLDQPDREATAVAFAQRVGQVVVLKGASTVVTDACRIYVNRTGNPGMATGGTGDVLTGVIAGLLGQGLDAFDAAILGAYVHGKAGDLAARRTGQLSMIATDVLDALPDAFKTLRTARTARR